jgi:hypothetical protein
VGVLRPSRVVVSIAIGTEGGAIHSESAASDLARRFGFVHDASFTALSSKILIVDPRVGFFQPLAERRVRFPTQISLNEHVVAVAAIHALVSSPRGRHVDVGSHGLTQPNPLGPLSPILA